MPEVLARFGDGDHISYTCSAPVVGGQLVVITGDRAVAPSADATHGCAGVAMYDQPIVPLPGGNAANVTVLSEGAFFLSASVALVAGTYVVPAVGGAVAPATAPDRGIGYVIAGGAAGGTALVQLTI